MVSLASLKKGVRDCESCMRLYLFLLGLISCYLAFFLCVLSCLNLSLSSSLPPLELVHLSLSHSLTHTHTFTLSVDVSSPQRHSSIDRTGCHFNYNNGRYQQHCHLTVSHRVLQVYTHTHTHTHTLTQTLFSACV